MKEIPSFDNQSLAEQAIAEHEGRYGSWRELFSSKKILGRMNVLLLAAAGWASMEAARLEAQNLRMVEDGGHPTLEFDQASRNKKTKNRAHVKLNSLDDFDAQSMIPSEVATSEIAQFIPAIYGGEHLRAENQKLVDTFMEEGLRDPLLRAFADIHSEEDAQDPTPHQGFKAALYLSKTKSKYNLSEADFRRYDLFERYFRTGFLGTKGAEGIHKRIQKFTKEVVGLAKDIRDAYEKKLQDTAPKGEPSRLREHYAQLRSDLEIMLSSKKEDEADAWTRQLEGRKAPSPVSALASAYQDAQDASQMQLLIDEHLEITGKYPGLVTQASEEFLAEKDGARQITALPKLIESMERIFTQYEGEYNKACSIFDPLKSKMEGSDKKSVDILITQGGAVCRNAADKVEYFFNWLKTHRGERLTNAFVFKITIPAKEAFPLEVSPMDHAINLAAVLTDIKQGTYILRLASLDSTPPSSGDAPEIKEAQEKLAHGELESRPKQKEGARIEPIAITPTSERILPQPHHTADEEGLYTGSLYPSKEFALIAQLYQEQLISAETLVTVLEQATPKIQISELFQHLLEKYKNTPPPLGRLGNPDAITEEEMYYLEGKAHEQYFRHRSGLFRDIQATTGSSEDKELLVAATNKLLRLLVEFQQYARSERERIQAITLNGTSRYYYNKLQATDGSETESLKTKNPAEASLYKLLTAYDGVLRGSENASLRPVLEAIAHQLEIMADDLKDIVDVHAAEGMVRARIKALR